MLMLPKCLEQGNALEKAESGGVSSFDVHYVTYIPHLIMYDSLKTESHQDGLLLLKYV